MITNHTELLNALIAKHNLKSYCEIGVQNPANNFSRIVCEFKTGVEPDRLDNYNSLAIVQTTSDNFFRINSEMFNPEKFDLIFIDGLHHADQVKRDFENSLRCLNDNGFILIHDCLPEEESTTHVPRDSKIWHGDVYKFCMALNAYHGVQFKTFNIDNGCMLIWKDANKKAGTIPAQIDWDSYIQNRHFALNITGTVEV